MVTYRRRINKDRRKGNGRRFCLGGRINSIPCFTSSCIGRFELHIGYELHQDDLKEKDEIILFFQIVTDKIGSAVRN